LDDTCQLRLRRCVILMLGIVTNML
jgi:hypothetical protein